MDRIFITDRTFNNNITWNYGTNEFGIPIIFKPGVEIREISPPLLLMFNILASFPPGGNAPKEFVITSIYRSPKGSRHRKHEAIDLRAHNVLSVNRESFRAELEGRLNKQSHLFFGKDLFRVLHEYIGTNNEHYHIQVKKGIAWPR